MGGVNAHGAIHAGWDDGGVGFDAAVKRVQRGNEGLRRAGRPAALNAVASVRPRFPRPATNSGCGAGVLSLGGGGARGRSLWRFAGEDLKAGQVVFRSGQRIHPAELGMIASLGIGAAEVEALKSNLLD